MLTKQDFREIRDMMREEVHDIVSNLMEHNIMPQFESIDKRFDAVDKRFERLEGDVGEIKATMVTKDFLEDRLADFKASLKTGAHTVNAKLNRLARLMHKKNILTAREFQEVTI